MRNLTIVLVLALLVSSCGLKPMARTAKDAAFMLCELVGAEQAVDDKIDGVSVGEWCDRAEVIKPFLDDILAAKMMGVSRVKQGTPDASK